MCPDFSRPDPERWDLDRQQKHDCYFAKWWEITVYLACKETEGPFAATLNEFSLISEFVSPRPNASGASEAPGSFTGRRTARNRLQLHFTHLFLKISSSSQRYRHRILLTQSETSLAAPRNLNTLRFLVETNNRTSKFSLVCISLLLIYFNI